MYLSVTLQVYRVQYSQLSIKQNKRYNTIYKLIKQTYSINTHLPKNNIAAILTKYTWYFVLNTKPLFYSFFVLSGHNMLSRIQFRRRSMFKCILSKYWTQCLSIDISWTGIRALLSAPILFDRQGRKIWHLFWEEKKIEHIKTQNLPIYYWWMMVYNYCSFDKWKKSVHNVCHWRIQTVAFYTILIFWRHLFKVSSIVILSSRNSTLIWDLGRRFSFYLLRRMLGKTATTSS